MDFRGSPGGLPVDAVPNREPREPIAWLSLLIVDRHSPGISVSPIAQVDGERFNEIRFDEVRVPIANRVGEENGAWPLMVESLATERHVQWCPKRLLRDFEDLVAWVRDCHLEGDPVVRNRIAELAVAVAEAQALGLVMVAAVHTGQPGGAGSGV